MTAWQRVDFAHPKIDCRSKKSLREVRRKRPVHTPRGEDGCDLDEEATAVQNEQVRAVSTSARWQNRPEAMIRRRAAAVGIAPRSAITHSAPPETTASLKNGRALENTGAIANNTSTSHDVA
jgi:hypothetical protein